MKTIPTILAFLLALNFVYAYAIVETGKTASGYEWTREVGICGSVAYTCSGNDQVLQSWDISGEKPSLLDEMGSTCYANLHVDCINNRVYTGDLHEGISIVDISNPASLQKISVYDFDGDARGQWVVGNRLYQTANDKAGVRIISITTEQYPFEIASTSSYGQAYDVACKGHYCYIADKGLTIVNVSNPESPAEIGRDNKPDCQAWWVELNEDGTIAVVSMHGCGLYIYDISNPASPTVLSHITEPITSGGSDVGRGMKPYIWNDVLITAAYGNGVILFNVSDWSNPTVLNQYRAKSFTSGQHANSGYALDYSPDLNKLVFIGGQLSKDIILLQISAEKTKEFPLGFISGIIAGIIVGGVILAFLLRKRLK